MLSISTSLLRVHFKWLVQLHTYIASLYAFVLDHQGFIKASIEAQKNDDNMDRWHCLERISQLLLVV